MAELRWDLLKSERLKKTRGVSFDEIVQARFLGAKRHPTRILQEIMLFEHRGYVWVVPFVRSGGGIFLKTLYPSRKYTRLHKRGELR
jgi:hypothetical protein